MILTRRKFLIGASIICAPAIVSAANIMPIFVREPTYPGLTENWDALDPMVQYWDYGDVVGLDFAKITAQPIVTIHSNPPWAGFEA